MAVRVDLPVLPVGESALVNLILDRFSGSSWTGDWHEFDPEVPKIPIMALADRKDEHHIVCFLSIDEIQPGSVACRLLVGVDGLETAEMFLVLLSTWFPGLQGYIEFLIELIQESLSGAEDGSSAYGQEIVLTDRDQRIIEMWIENYTAQEIGDDPNVSLSAGRVRNELTRLRKLLGAGNVPFHSG